MKYAVAMWFIIDADSEKEARDRFEKEEIDIVRELVGAKKSGVIAIEKEPNE